MIIFKWNSSIHVESTGINIKRTELYWLSRYKVDTKTSNRTNHIRTVALEGSVINYWDEGGGGVRLNRFLLSNRNELIRLHADCYVNLRISFGVSVSIVCNAIYPSRTVSECKRS